jgi:hypothetical protein
LSVSAVLAEPGSVTDSSITKSNPPAEEAPVQIVVEKIGGFNLISYAGDKIYYLPVGELFSRLKINCTISADGNSVSGFFVDEKSVYFIDAANGFAEIKGEKIKINRSDFYVSETDIYLNSELFGKIFGIKIDVDSKQLRAFLTSSVKLPAVSEIERNSLREYSENKDETKTADFLVPRKRKLLGLGVLDWGASYSHMSPRNDYYNYNISAGSEILGGDFTAYLTGNKNNILDNGISNWRWRYVEDKKWFKQGIAGDLYSNLGLLHNIQGVQITNSPPVARKTTAKYKIFDKIYPDWEVELYINNEFIAYTKANDNGYFEFNVPLLYGSNYITLKYYGTSGEIRYDERVIQVPFNFLPEGTLEYNIMGGVLKSTNNSTFSESSVSFGAADFMTIGGGTLYLNRPGISKFYPNANASLRIMEDLVLSTNYFYGLKGTASISLLLPSQVYSTFSYLRYAENNYFNPLNFREEENITAYLPFTFNRFSASIRINARNIEARDYNLKILSSGMFLNYNRIQGSIISNLAWTKGQGKYDDAGSRTITGISYRLLSDLLLRQQTDFNHSAGKISNAGFFIDKSVFKAGWLSVFLFRDFINNSYNGGITFRFDFSFGRYSAGYLSGDNGSSYIQSLSGSVGFDQFNRKFIMDNQNMVSRGGLTLVPFLDANNNSRLDENERILKADFNTNIKSGRPLRSSGNNNFWFLGLDPYDTYRLEVNPVSFENPVYRPKYISYDVTVDPNRFKEVPVPVYVSGTISGNVVLKTDKGNKSVPSLHIIMESEDGTIKFGEMTFSDGEFIFNNVPPGKYRIYADPDDLSARTLESINDFQTAEIKNSEDENTAFIPDIVLVKK